MSYDLQKSLKRYYDQGIRVDGRKLDEIRPVSIERGASKNAEGSAKVTIGETVVYAGVKMQLEKPYDDTPDRGNLMVNAELTPMANPDFESGPPSEWAIEISRVVDRTVREGGAIDLKSLCVTPGEQVWAVMIDIVPVNDAGSLMDAASIAALAALEDARFPKIGDDGKVNYKEHTDSVKLGAKPILVTVYRIGEHMIVDPTYEEERGIESRLSIGIMEDGTICALQKGAQQGLTPEEIETALNKAKATVAVYREALSR